MDMRFTCLDKIPYSSLCELWKEDGMKKVWGVRKLVRIPYCKIAFLGEQQIVVSLQM